jgi:hypothetical protein
VTGFHGNEATKLFAQAEDVLSVLRPHVLEDGQLLARYNAIVHHFKV